MGIEQSSNAGARLVPGASPAGAATMRAAVQHRYGPPSVLESSEVGLPLPGRGDVLVQVGAASVHPGDYVVMTGEPYVVRLAFGLRRPRHGIPGRDLAGVVAAVGKDVTALRPGDEVVRLEHRWNARGVRLRPSGQPRVRAAQPVGRGRGSGPHVCHDGVAGIARHRRLGPLGRIVKARVLSGFTRQQPKPFLSLGKRQDLLTLADLLTTGQVTPVIDRTYPLDEAAGALRYVAAGHARGKVVITV